MGCRPSILILIRTTNGANEIKIKIKITIKIRMGNWNGPLPKK